jgi:hypothetical protein
VMAAMRRPANATLIAVGTAGLLSGVGIAWILAHGGPDRPGVPNLPLAVPVAVLVGWSFIGSGLLYWRSRPDNYLGPVMIFQGFAWFVSLLVSAHNPVLFTLGEALYGLQYVSGLYLVLSFPSGRLQGRLDRALIVSTIVIATVVNWTWLLFADPHRMLCRVCPANVLEVTRNDAAVIGVNYVIRVTGIAIALIAIALLARRWLRASRPQRHAVLPVAVARDGRVRRRPRGVRGPGSGHEQPQCLRPVRLLRLGGHPGRDTGGADPAAASARRGRRPGRRTGRAGAGGRSAAGAGPGAGRSVA